MNDPTSIEQEDNEVQLQELNEVYWPLKPLERLAKLFSEVDHDEILVTSSFGTTSGILMGMITKVAPGHPCLLYTSPSPRDLSTSRMPSSA